MATPNPQAQKGGYGYRPPVVKTPQVRGVKDPQTQAGGYGYRPPINKPPAWLSNVRAGAGVSNSYDPLAGERAAQNQFAAEQAAAETTARMAQAAGQPDYSPNSFTPSALRNEDIARRDFSNLPGRVATSTGAVMAPKDKPAGFLDFIKSLYGWSGQHPFAQQPKKKDGPTPQFPTGTFFGADGQAVPNSTGAYWLPQNLPQYPTGSFFGGGGQYVAGPMDMMGLPAPDTGGFGSQYSGWGRRGGGGGGYGGGDYVPPWYMNLFSLNWER